MKIKIEDVQKLVAWLNYNRPNTAPYTIEETIRYFRIVSQNRSAYCFVVKERFESKALGICEAGHLMYPATYDRPAKHSRGILNLDYTWDAAFNTWGMATLK